MTQKINPFVLKPFAVNATNNGQFGSYEEGTKKITNDYNEIQALPAWEEGWNSAVKSGTVLPRLEEMQGLQYTTTSAITCLNQQGIREWLADETYYIGSVVKFTQNNVCYFFYSTIDNNINNLPTPGTINNFWKRIDQFLPVWNEFVNYKLREKVCYILEGQYLEFRSLKDNNIGNIPPVGAQADSNWARVYPEFTRRYEANITYCLWDEVFYIINGNYCKYISLQNNNLGHTPPDSQSDSWWYRTSAPQTQFSLFTNVVQVGSVASYTAPEDGCFVVNVDTQENGWNAIQVYVNGRCVIQWGKNGYINSQFSGNVYVKKGSLITMTWSGLDSLNSWFAYTN